MSSRSVAVRRAASKRAKRVARCDELGVRRRHRRPFAIEAGIAIEERELHCGIEERLMLVLAVQIDQVEPTASRSVAVVTSWPSRKARLRPCAETSRLTISSSPDGVSSDRLHCRRFFA